MTERAATNRARRLAAGAIALLAAAGIAINLAMVGRAAGVVAGLWALARFFTITTNLYVGAALTAVALGGRVGPRVIGGLTLSIVLVGVIYQSLLRGLVVLSPLGAVADTLLHVATPILMPVYWLLFEPRRTLRWREPAIWALYPLLYLVYALVRGQADGRYPYPFLDVPRIGWTRMLLNCAAIAVGFVLSGLVLVAIDRWLPRRHRAEPPPHAAVGAHMPGRLP